jgi:hypothetical protein
MRGRWVGVVRETVATVVVAVGAGLGLRWFDADVAGALPWAAGIAAAVVFAAGSVLVLTGRVQGPTGRARAFLWTTVAVLTALLLLALCYRRDAGLGPAFTSAPALAVTVLTGVAGALLLARVIVLARAGGERAARTRPLVALRATRPWRYGWILLALTVLWLPSIVFLAPGSTTYDGTRQIDELIGARVPSLDFAYYPTNHHPWFATLWQGALLRAGMLVSGGDINAGLLLHSLVLVAVSLLTYAFVVARIQRLTGDRVWTLVALLFFGILPHFADYAMLYEKTGWYQVAILWFFVGVVDVATRAGRLAWRLLQLAGAGALATLFRPNGLYIVLPTLVVLALLLLGRDGRRRLVEVAVSAVAVVVVFFGWTNVALPGLGVAPASPAEGLIVPFQQVARIVLDDGASLTPDQRATIDAVLPIDELEAAYTPENGDGVKGLYEIDSFLVTELGIEKMRGREDWWRDDAELRAELGAFLRLWPQLVLEHPGTALSATIQNTYLYYAPILDRGNDVSLFSGGLPDKDVLVNEYTDDYRHLAGEAGNRALTAYHELWATRGLSVLANPGLYGWIVIALGISLLFWPRRERLMVYVPVALVYLVNFAGARNGDFRYAVPLVALLPLCLAVWGRMRHRPAAEGQPADVEAQPVTR